MRRTYQDTEPASVPGGLANIECPSDLRLLTPHELAILADQIRDFLVDNVSRTGGHLGPNLGVVELTLALHRVFDSPRDRILWDTGHQAYVHKLVTGRRENFGSLRTHSGISGYPNRAESVHDIIENSHASTALSWADGLAKAFGLGADWDRRVVAVVGDGALTGGMSWEALNNIGGADRPVVVVLNDNGRSYSPTVGGVAEHLARLRDRPSVPGTTVFETLGLRYIGPIDGHDLGAVESALHQAKSMRRPVVVHCITQKGKGFAAAEQHEADCLHTVRAGYRVDEPADTGTSWTSVFATELVALATQRPDIVGITAAMLHPVGLHGFAKAFPERVFDVGIAEQHAATSAAGLAIGGMHPVVPIYATFLNRAFDQVLMDTALHRCGITFVLDRAGVTGDDGASHNGMWDMSVLQLVPHLRIAAPRDGAQLRRQLTEAVSVSDAPTVVRFPKGAVGADIEAVDQVGSTDVLGHFGGSSLDGGDVLLIGIGAMAETCLGSAEDMARSGVRVTVVDPRWVKPVDSALVQLAAAFRLVISVEDNGRVGGVGSSIAQTMRDMGVWTPLRDLGIPQRFLEHSTRAGVLADIGLTRDGIAAVALAELTRLGYRQTVAFPMDDGTAA